MCKHYYHARKAREQHKAIMSAIKHREDNFRDDKGKMLSSALNRDFKRINTSNIIHEGDFISEPSEVKAIINSRAQN